MDLSMKPWLLKPERKTPKKISQRFLIIPSRREILNEFPAEFVGRRTQLVFILA
jgi:hypothetical protein